jgi:pimeloyl-ACP methyl ester carboxylesterase
VKKWLKIGGGVILAVILAFVGVSAWLGYSMTRNERVPVEGDPGELDLAYEDVSFPSAADDLTLRGWFLPVEDSDRVIVMVHGAGANRADASNGMLDIAAGLVQNGFNVLTFDLRGCGESEGDMVSGGYFEKRDLEGAVAYLKERGFDRIGVLGFSLGAVTSLLAAPEDPDIDAIVSDSSFADLNDIMKPEFHARTKAPGFFLTPILLLIKVMYGVDFPAIRPIGKVADIAPRPVFFIHGEADETIPVAHAQRLYEAADNPADELWTVPGAGHTQAYNTGPEEYLERVTAFFDAAL